MPNHSNYFYVFKCVLVDCVWSEWVDGSCSTACGEGTQTNTRTKQIVEANGGNCTGDFTETVACLVTTCPTTFVPGTN